MSVQQLRGNSNAEFFGFLPMPEAFFVYSIKYRIIYSKQRTSHRDSLWLYPMVRLANSLEKARQIPWHPIHKYLLVSNLLWIEGNQGAFLSGVYWIPRDNAINRTLIGPKDSCFRTSGPTRDMNSVQVCCTKRPPRNMCNSDARIRYSIAWTSSKLRSHEAGNLSWITT